ncbi:type II toxin-antitoxin system RelE/ParE family toxin [Leptospira fletcheri]|uniref:Type II toxin-antitoxin system RelE/ParE family toxin n=1 Tax=Leptospira fletcheri TaxID=2484981 RepID=A0A4R9GKC1_9LEPT|nr:type II toxin-antitoxin system RelE/ParE family toxin [Leptospira fletcheri]TGK14150.1 type II toxin-antitoxin system RelE/ParE family toxin [Leptospira fletcheri]
MPEYFVFLSKTAGKQLDKLPDSVAETLLKTIESLAKNPKPQGVKKLKGRDGYRIRKGDYRIIYDIVDMKLVVEVIAIGHRKDIYS